MDPVPADRLGFGFSPITPDTTGTSGAITADAQVDLLALLLNISAILAGLTAASLLALGLGALGVAAGGGPGSREADVAAGFVAACASTAAGLRRRRPWSRPAALLLALVMLVIAPFGTALGIYAFWVLLRQRARELLGAENGPVAG
jgi:hypothetical protein